MKTLGFRDHPRSRGEYSPDHGDEAAKVGSSPLSRGIHVAAAAEAQVKRIIPALAGNTVVAA